MIRPTPRSTRTDTLFPDPTLFRSTTGEIALARTVFGDAIDYARVRVRRYKWIFFQPRRIVMAPMGDLHFHPKGGVYCDDFSCPAGGRDAELQARSEEHTSELQSLMRISYAVFCLKKKTKTNN